MSLETWLTQPAGQVLTLTLFHFVWQGVLVVLGLIAVVMFCGIRQPSTRYACSLAALLAMTAFPLATLTWLSLGREISSFSQPLSLADLPAFALNLAPSVDRSLFSTGPEWIAAMQPYALAAWMGGVVFFGARLIAGAIGVAELRRNRLPVPAELAMRIERLGTRLRLDAARLVFLSNHVTDAMALGLVRRLVLVPAAWASEMPLDMLEAVIAHELAHLRRMDLWANFLQRIVETLFFYHPAVWWLSRRLRVERELCSDELAVEATGERLIYAQTLEHIANGRQADIRPAFAAFLRGEENMRLLQRIRNVLAPSSSQRGHWPAGLAALGLAVCLWTLSLALLDTLTPAAHAEEPAQEENSEETSDEGDVQIDENSDEDSTLEEDAESDESEVIKRKVAEALKKTFAQADEAKKKAFAQADEAKKKKLDRASIKRAEKPRKVRLDEEQLESEVLKKALAQHAEEFDKMRLKGEQLNAEAMKKALDQHAEMVGKARLLGEELDVEALKKALHQQAEKLKKAHLQGEIDKAQWHNFFLETQARDKAFVHANDERIEQLTAMVKELAGKVEELQDELKKLRAEDAGKSSGKEGKLKKKEPGI